MLFSMFWNEEVFDDLFRLMLERINRVSEADRGQIDY